MVNPASVTLDFSGHTITRIEGSRLAGLADDQVRAEFDRFRIYEVEVSATRHQ